MSETYLKRIWLLLILFIISSCASSKKITGFTIEKERVEGWASVRIESAEYINNEMLSGRFLRVTHENGRFLDLFVPKDSIEFSIKRVVEEVELTNNTNVWPFFHTTFTRYPFSDFYCSDSVVKTFLNISKTGISIDHDNSIYKSYRYKSYEVEEYYQENVSFCKLKVKTKYINEYNKWDRIRGEPHYRKSEISRYMFSEQDEYMNILIVAHEKNCGC
tara:strand:- start:138 stop:791 length:654 start_codon:yes stop_codon:yes gene_type:complete